MAMHLGWAMRAEGGIYLRRELKRLRAAQKTMSKDLKSVTRIPVRPRTHRERLPYPAPLALDLTG